MLNVAAASNLGNTPLDAGVNVLLILHDQDCPGRTSHGAGCICSPDIKLMSADAYTARNRAQRRAAAKKKGGAR